MQFRTERRGLGLEICNVGILSSVSKQIPNYISEVKSPSHLQSAKALFPPVLVRLNMSLKQVVFQYEANILKIRMHNKSKGGVSHTESYV